MRRRTAAGSLLSYSPGEGVDAGEKVQSTHAPADRDSSTRPNHDGPLRRLALGVAFTNIQSIEFLPDGTARSSPGSGNGVWSTIPAGGTLLSVSNGTVSRSIAVNGMGRVQIRR